jgi:response regulator RpfG family c-di-GMP phosphodiesterase
MKKILILENGKTIRNIMTNLVDNENYKILLSKVISRDASNSKLPNEIPDLVIADLTSIKKEKVELLLQLKNNPVISLVPFLLITSEKGMSTKEMYSAFNYYQRKPFTKEELFALVKKIINHTNSLSPW